MTNPSGWASDDAPSSLADMARKIAALDLHQNETNQQGCDRQTSDAILDEMYRLRGEILQGEPRSVSDAIALLLAASSEFRGILDEVDGRCDVMEGWLALGRAIGFLVDDAGLTLPDIGGRYFESSVGGLDNSLRAEWWIDQAINAGLVLVLDKNERVEAFAVSDSDPEDAEERSELLAELPEIDPKKLGFHLSVDVSVALREAGHRPVPTTKDRRWLVTKAPRGPHRLMVVEI